LIIIFRSLQLPVFFGKFIRGKYKFAPVWLCCPRGFMAIAISQLHLSSLEIVWPGKFGICYLCHWAVFVLGFLVFDKVWQINPCGRSLNFGQTEFFRQKITLGYLWIVYGFISPRYIFIL